ncbi:MAG: hypothetical protein KAW01_07380, partial [Deltaproteobacteria bacterium]|nr:hypothetical protein [Deltaproteobacteria bacterium]
TKFTDGISSHKSLYQQVFSEQVFVKLMEVAEMAGNNIDFPKTLWAKVIFDYAVFYQTARNRQQVLQSLIPLYYGFISSFVHETENLDDYQAEEVIEELCQIYEDSKPYLVERWQQNKR